MRLSYASSILGRKFGVYSAPISISPYDSDAQAWFNAIATAGGSITTANKTAFNTAFLALKAGGSAALWPNLVLGGFLCGVSDGTGGAGTGVQAAITCPIKNAGSYSTTNSGFSSTDYTILGGLVANGTGTITSTLDNTDSIFGSNNDRHLYCYTPNFTSLNPAGYLMWSKKSSNGTARLSISSYSTTFTLRAWIETANNGISTATGAYPSLNAGLGAYHNGSIFTIQAGGTNTATYATQYTPVSGTFTIFDSSLTSGFPLSFYAIGGDIPDSGGIATGGNTSRYDSIISQLMSSLT
jgi:hypothetical protein